MGGAGKIISVELYRIYSKNLQEKLSFLHKKTGPAHLIYHKLLNVKDQIIFALALLQEVLFTQLRST